MSDISKMFRRISIENGDRDVHRIVRAPYANQATVDNELKTVTYGTACVLYLSLRTVQQLANEGQPVHPVTAIYIRDEIYVDDIFSDTNSRVKES